MRVLHTLTSLSPEAGGPSYTVPALALAQAAKIGAEISLATLDQLGVTVPSGLRHIKGKAVTLPKPFDRVAFSPELRRVLRVEIVDVVHTHGLWQMPPLYGALHAIASGVPFIMAPRGMLSPVALGFSPHAKKMFGKLVQNRLLNRANAFHATADSEYDDIRARGFRQPVAVIPNGVDLPDLVPRNTAPRRRILSLGRIHPKKGLDTLIVAWTSIANNFPDWHLRIVGPDERGHAAELTELAVRIGAPRTEICGPAFGKDKWIEYNEAGLFVLPTKSENFAVTVAEALAAETPVISSKGAPWAELERNRCGWWIEYGAEPLAATLASALRLDENVRRTMGERGREWMSRDYSWYRIANDIFEVYGWLQSGGTPPRCVREN